MTKPTILVCDGHQHYPTPLIWTLAFRNAEFWCPFCGATHSMIYAGIEIPATEELKERKRLFKEASETFLYATGTATAAFITWKDAKISPDQLPAEEKARIKAILENGWKYQHKIEINESNT